ncbi:hypothetical protein CSV80_14415 [Sporosarcina sp. P12(2017)]|uniref:hypothetical protein n=1 Tax=Sporosarcina sp. P10 TaxID=2048264 RepID=UPI000C168D12|nr:hypothetical protein [Sporosarcina sp. P10]PIC56440.1 hypothetical protein CSV81_14280 [Sporosarcina sp. P10]PIC59737.1 hypothetical protein CSV80_14415 [Sporosarcina sp. P12(2017)]
MIKDISKITGFFSVFIVPIRILFADRKEMLKEASYIRIEEFKKKASKIYEKFYPSDQLKGGRFF